MHHQPTIFHITHWKAGSQWVRAVLSQAHPERAILPKAEMTQFFEDEIVPGGIYTPLYTNRKRFLERLPDGLEHIAFVVIRDIRDTLISWYFSMLYSHPENPNVVQIRERLSGMDEEEGLLHLAGERLRAIRDIQGSWLDSDALIIRYEDLLADEHTAFRRIRDHCRLDISDDRLAQIVDKNSFERRAGRARGDEDVSQHFRKGVAGDWKNHFTDRVNEFVKREYGQILVRAGYERGTDW